MFPEGFSSLDGITLLVKNCLLSSLLCACLSLGAAAQTDAGQTAAPPESSAETSAAVLTSLEQPIASSLESIPAPESRPTLEADLAQAEENPPSEQQPAAPEQSSREPIGGDFFLKFYTGFAGTQNSDLQLSQPAAGNELLFNDVSWIDASWGKPNAPYYGIRLGYFLEDLPWLGVMVDFLHFKAIAETGKVVNVSGTRLGAPINAAIPMSSIVSQYQMTNGINFLTFNALARWQLDVSEEFPHGRFQPYAGAGLGPTFHQPEIVIDGISSTFNEYQWGELGVQALVGVSYYIIPELDLFTEYRFTHTQTNLDTPLGGKGMTPINTHHIVFGTGVHF